MNSGEALTDGTMRGLVAVDGAERTSSPDSPAKYVDLATRLPGEAPPFVIEMMVAFTQLRIEVTIAVGEEGEWRAPATSRGSRLRPTPQGHVSVRATSIRRPSAREAMFRGVRTHPRMCLPDVYRASPSSCVTSDALAVVTQEDAISHSHAPFHDTCRLSYVFRTINARNLAKQHLSMVVKERSILRLP